jgi:hypothetical protein
VERKMAMKRKKEEEARAVAEVGDVRLKRKKRKKDDASPDVRRQGRGHGVGVRVYGNLQSSMVTRVVTYQRTGVKPVWEGAC